MIVAEVIVCEPGEGELALSDYPLHSHDWRVAFLRELYMQGYPALLAAVSRAWTLMERPKAARCTYVGILAGTGGKGKKALYNFLRSMISDALAVSKPIPPIADHHSLEAWNQAVTEQWADQLATIDLLIERYALLWVGRTTEEPKRLGLLVSGPWGSPV